MSAPTPEEAESSEVPSLEALVHRANDGDRMALEEIVRRIQDRVYGLALRMLWHPEDARDATQEILIRIVTHLGTFREESTFSTWVYRVASNYLLTTRKRRAERESLTFEQFGQQLDEGLSDAPLPASNPADQALLVEEVKIGCTQGMLLCLDRGHRLAYILGEIFEVKSKEGAYILEITPAAFRKRLSRSRKRIRTFMQQKCGLVNPRNPCRCSRRVHRAIEEDRVDPDDLQFATHPVRARQDHPVIERVREMEALERAAAVFQSQPDYAAPDVFVERIKQLIDAAPYKVLQDEVRPS